MILRSREALLAVAVVLLIAAGLALDRAGAEVEPPPHVDKPAPFAERATYCPPVGPGSRSLLTAASGGDSPIRITTSADAAPTTLSPDRVLVAKSEAREPADVVGIGGPVAAGALTVASDPVSGAGAASCSADASARWYFAAGSSALGFDERILIYNPFPDEAVIRLSFFTPAGAQARTGLSEVAVPAGSFESVAINEFIQVKSSLGVGLAATRGRVVAWRELFVEADQKPGGVQFSIGGRAPAEQWYFADGLLGAGADEVISVLNPSMSKEAVVTITLATGSEVVQLPELIEQPVPPGAAVSFSLTDAAGRNLPPKLTGVSATVTSNNGVGVVAERTLRLNGEDLSGVSAELGVARPAERWYVPPALADPVADVIAVFNPSPETATLDIALLSAAGEARRPATLQDIEVRSNSRVRLPIGELTRGRIVGAVVESSGPVVAERFSYSAQAGDISSVAGVPLRQLPP